MLHVATETFFKCWRHFFLGYHSVCKSGRSQLSLPAALSTVNNAYRAD